MSGRDYEWFWSQLADRFRREVPGLRVGSPHRNDLPLFSPLPATQLKCNFSRTGLRVELLFTAHDPSVNTHRLQVFERHLPELQRSFGPEQTLHAEALPGRTQTRLAAYRSGTIREQDSWPEFQDWLIETVVRFSRGLAGSIALIAEWGI